MSANRPYDLLCSKGTKQLRVEVKGTTSGGSQILLTRNEAVHAKAHSPHIALVVVSEILLDRIGSESYAVSGGKVRIIQPWNLSEDRLEPLAYSYRIDF